MERELVCPSGLTGVIRSIKLKDEQLFTDQRLIKNNGLMQALLERCWVKTIDPGPYTLAVPAVNGSRVRPVTNVPSAPVDVALPWGRVLQGDAFYAFLQLRALSFGDEYAFSAQCEACGRKSEVAHPLDLTQMEVRKLPASSRERLISGQLFQVSFLDHTFFYKLLVLEDERGLAMLRENRKLPPRLANLVQRIAGIDAEHTPQAEVIKFVGDLDSGDAADLEDALDAVDCGVSTLIDFECGYCHDITKVLLPFEASFLRRRRSSESPSTDMTGSTG
jgi:hypothetical protein